jgi:hypothetical protein
MPSCLHATSTDSLTQRERPWQAANGTLSSAVMPAKGILDKRTETVLQNARAGLWNFFFRYRNQYKAVNAWVVTEIGNSDDRWPGAGGNVRN